MAKNKKPAKQYRPKMVVVNPVARVLQGLVRVNDHREAVLLRAQTHAAMDEIVQGRGNRQHLGTLVCMMNTMLTLINPDVFGKQRAHELGSDHQDEIIAANQAIYAMGMRAAGNGGRFTFTAPEMRAVNYAIELHDVQLGECTVKEIEIANRHIAKVIDHRHARVIPKPANTETIQEAA